MFGVHHPILGVHVNADAYAQSLAAVFHESVQEKSSKSYRFKSFKVSPTSSSSDERMIVPIGDGARESSSDS